MSPIIELQRRLVEAGRIRSGDTTNGRPQKLDKWRLTSKDKVRLEHAANLWGGTVAEWDKRPGEYELYTDTDSLPIMLLPEAEATVWYEEWTRGGCQRRCDGETELLSDGPCLCDPESRTCKPHLRFPVLLPDLPGIGSWLVQSTGWNAAAEIPQVLALLGRAASQGEVLPARLRLEQRHSVKAGQTHRFAVPVIDVDVSLRELVASSRALAAAHQPLAIEAPTYTPIPPRTGNGVTLAAGLAAAETQTVTRTARSAAPIPAVDDDIEFGTGPVPVPDESGAAPAIAAPETSASPGQPESAYEGPGEAEPSKPLTRAEVNKKLNALVGQLRDAGEITTAQLYSALAKSRNLEVDHMIDVIERARDATGELHWAPLRDSLSLEEARDLHARLAKLWATKQEQGS